MAMAPSQAYLNIVEYRLRRLLHRKTWLLRKLEDPGGKSLLCLEYWREYHGLQYRLRDFDEPLPSPETILRLARALKLTKHTRTEESLREFFRSAEPPRRGSQ